jgi:hypothetical protein
VETEVSGLVKMEVQGIVVGEQVVLVMQLEVVLDQPPPGMALTTMLDHGQKASGGGHGNRPTWKQVEWRG